MSDLLKEVTRLLNRNRLSYLMERSVDSEGGEMKIDSIKFPKFKINEKHWGKKADGSNEDRQIIENIAKGLPGHDPLSRVEALRSFLVDQLEGQDVSTQQVISNLMFLDIFASIVYDFNASVAGFLFESLFAGVFDGWQIDATAGGGEAGTTDVVLMTGKAKKQETEYSFKLLSPKTTIKGSFTDLIDGISKSPDAREIYLVVEKEGAAPKMTLNFYEFDITKENWFNFIGHPVGKRESVYAPKEFVFGEDGTPKGVATDRKKVAKMVNGKIVERPVSDAPLPERRTYKALEGEEFEYKKASDNALSDTMKLSDEEGNRQKPGFILVVGRTYRINAKTDEQRYVIAPEKSKNFTTLYGGFIDNPEKFKQISGMDMDFMTYITKGETGEAPYMSDPNFFELLKNLPTYGSGKGAGQFEINPNFMKNHPKTRKGSSLELDRDAFASAAAFYVEQVGSQVYQIFNDLSDLISSISNYFITEDSSQARGHAQLAKKSAKALQESTEAHLKEDQGAPPSAKATRGQQKANVLPMGTNEHKLSSLDLDSIIESMIAIKKNS